METKPFHYTRKQLVLTGILELPNAPKYLRNAITVLSITLVFHDLTAAFLYFLLEDKSFFEKTESLLDAMGVAHIFSKVLVLPFKRKILLSVMSDLDEMSLHSNRQEELRKLHRRNVMISRKIPETVILLVCLLVVSGTLASVVRYSTSGTVSPPLQLYIPFKGRHILFTVLYNYFTIFFPTCSYAVITSTIIVLSLNISSQISYLVWKLKMLGANSNPSDVDSCILLHQKILRVVRKVNELVSGLLFFEYLLTTSQCCLSGYQLLADNKNDNTATLLYNCTFFVVALTTLSVNYHCGNMVKLKSEQIFEAAYYNNWYELKTAERRQLVVIMLISSKPLTYSYRHLITFDLVLYGGILKAAYSLMTVLQTMEK